MGNHLDKPVLQKTTETSAANGLRFGASGMQGWRTGMAASGQRTGKPPSPTERYWLQSSCPPLAASITVHLTK